ncbi:hypothetical protein [Motilimonas sp. KMU-193]|uniref:hypothetical protein n=1 Tax=Motilimonas sp. KMU-193 TaxID=3388668 RepID=UPI00396AF4B8
MQRSGSCQHQISRKCRLGNRLLKKTPLWLKFEQKKRVWCRIAMLYNTAKVKLGQKEGE